MLSNEIRCSIEDERRLRGDGTPSNGRQQQHQATTTDYNVHANHLNCNSSSSINNNEKLGPFISPSIRSVKQQKIGRFRHVIALLALSTIVLANLNRQAYNSAIVRMVRAPVRESKLLNNTQKTSVDSTAVDGLADLKPLIDTTNKIDSQTDDANRAGHSSLSVSSYQTVVKIETGSDKHRYDWDGLQISLLQAAFSYGYVPLMIAGGRLSEIYGAKWIIFTSCFGTALCALLTPILADLNFFLLVFSRFMMGICQTGVSPALYALLTRWLPPNESSVYLAMIKVGVMIGFMFGSLINGYIPWRPMFYLLGLLGIFWSIVWTLLVSSGPKEHKLIKESELQYILLRLSEHAREAHGTKKSADPEPMKSQENNMEGEGKNRKSAPWLSIIKNPVVIAFTLTKFTVKLSTDAQSMQIPMYLAHGFQMDDELNGILNSINFALQAFLTGMVAYVAKEMIERHSFGLDKTGVRKLFQGINNFGMALAYLLIAFNFGSMELVCFAVILLSIASMFGSGGEAVLPVDLTTEYAASIMAIANCTANLSGMLLPAVVSFLLNNQLSSVERWTKVWCFVSAITALGGLIFVSFVEARQQQFADNPKPNHLSIVKGIKIIEVAPVKSPVTLTSFRVDGQRQ